MTPNKRKATALAIAVAVAIPAEGLRQHVYRDPVGIATVCYGTTGKDVVPGKVYSIAECKALLDRDMLDAVDKVESCVPGLPAKTMAAFADAVYNLGPALVCDPGRSTAARMLKAGDVRGACNQLPRWDKGRVAGVMVPLPGLTKRRAREQALCLEGLS